MFKNLKIPEDFINPIIENSRAGPGDKKLQ